MARSRYLTGTDVLGAGFDVSSLLSSFGGGGGAFGSGGANPALEAAKAEERHRAEEKARADASSKHVLYGVIGVLGVAVVGGGIFLAVRK